MLVSLVCLVLCLYYLLLVDYATCCGGAEWGLEDDGALTSVRWSFQFLAVGALVLLSVIPLLRHFHNDSQLFEIASATYCVLVLTYVVFHVGPLSLLAGLILVSYPMAAYTLLNRRVVWFSSLALWVGQGVTAVGSGLQWWSYGPWLSIHPSSPSFSLAVMVQMYSLALPILLLFFGMSFLVLKRWRRREEKVRLLSVTDPLTGLFNRRSIVSYLDHERARSVNKGPVLSLLMVDLDHFKQINDSKGHEAGDFTLLAAADALQQCLRQNDRLGRYGGEEFLVILPGTDLAGALIIAERCRFQLETTAVSVPDTERFNFTASFGVICNEGDIRLTVGDMLSQVEAALNVAKQRGRNQVCTHVDLIQ